MFNCFCCRILRLDPVCEQVFSIIFSNHICLHRMIEYTKFRGCNLLYVLLPWSILKSFNAFISNIWVVVFLSIMEGFPLLDSPAFISSREKIRLKELIICRKLKFIIPITLEPDGFNLWYFKLRLFDLPENIVLKS